MDWKIEYTRKADKDLEKLSSQSRKEIRKYLDDKVLKASHPKDFGKPLSGNMKGLWRYRVDKFRIVCKMEDSKLIILVLQIAKRDVVYED